MKTGQRLLAYFTRSGHVGDVAGQARPIYELMGAMFRALYALMSGMQFAQSFNTLGGGDHDTGVEQYQAVIRS